MNDTSNYFGNPFLLKENVVGIFCSTEIDLASYYDMIDFIKLLCELPLVFASGWQSNIEKRVLRDLISCKIIYFLAKDIEHFKPSTLIQRMLDQNNAFVVSNIYDMSRATKESVKKRDKYILTILDKILILNMSELGHLEHFVIDALQQQKKVFVFDHFSNSNWIEKYPSLIPISKNNLDDLL